MSRELDPIDDPEAEERGLLVLVLRPYDPPEVTSTVDDGNELEGLSRPASRSFDFDRHLATLESHVGKWVPIWVIVLMVLTFGTLAFGPNSASDVAVQVAALFLSVISGTLGYVFGRQSSS